MNRIVKKFFVFALLVFSTILVATLAFSETVFAAQGETLLFDDYYQTWNIGATGRPADENGLEYGRDPGAAATIPSPFPFNDSVKFDEQMNMRGGRVNPADTTYFTRNKYMMQPLTQNESYIVYSLEDAEDVTMMVSHQIFDPNPVDVALARVKLYGSVDGVTYVEVPLQAEIIDIVGVNHLTKMTNRTDLDETYTHFKFTFTLLNNNFWEILVISTHFTGIAVNGEVAFSDSFNGQWPIDAVGVNEDQTPNYAIGGRLPYVDPTNTALGRLPFADNFTPKAQLVSYTGLTNGRVQPSPTNFQYNDWVLILSQQTANMVYMYDSTFSNFSLVIFRQIWDNSLDTVDAVKVYVSADGVDYDEIVYDEQVLKTDGTNYYISLTNKTALEAGIKYLKIEFAHHQANNYYELGISNVRLMTDRSFGVPVYKDIFSNQWPIDAVGVNEDQTPNYAIGGRLPYVDPANTTLGRVPFADNYNPADEVVSWTGLTNGRVQPNPASFVYSDWMLILAATQAQMVYEYEAGFKNVNLQIFRQIYNNSLPMAEAVKISVSNDGTTYTPVTISFFVERQSGVDTMYSVFNKLELEDDYTFLKIEFAHHNTNFYELGITTVSLFGATPDVVGEVDREAPVIAVSWNLATTLDQNTQVTLPVATATDNADENPVVTVSVLSPFNSNVTVTNNQFYLTAQGDYTVVYRAEDVSGNFSTREFVITSVIPVDEPEEPAGLGTGAIVAITVGSATALGGAAFFIIRKRRVI